jgi:hypothetical protein
MALFIRSDRSQDFVQSARRGALARSDFFARKSMLRRQF